MYLVSTIVEIFLYYLTIVHPKLEIFIYNSRNFSILLNNLLKATMIESTIVEIFLYYLTLVL